MRHELVTLAALVLYAASIIAGFTIYGRQETKNQELENEIRYMRLQLQETEARCTRMTDTCIDILANRRWEEGSE